MPPTVFLAFQCCQCSTMQVKQQKKSSNKWTCVVCNQKQSVRKVFAQGFMAKDVRKFVQNFNMSRQFSEQNLILLDENTETLEIGGKQKRTDWTEYIDPGEGEKEESETPNDIYRNPGDELEPKIVTEMPKLVFKKPKLNSYRVAKDCEERNIRSSKSKFQDGESSRHHQEVVRGTQQERGDYASKVKGKFADKQEGMKLEQPMRGMSKWKGFLGQEDNVNLANEIPQRKQSAIAEGARRTSKWSCYMTEDDGDLFLGSGTDAPTEACPWNDQNAFGTELIDQRVEEDVHPDFV